MMRLSGSVKLRCALASGRACSGSGTFGALPLGLLPRLLFQLRLGLRDLLQTALPPRQLLRQLVAATALAILRIFGRIGCLGLLKQRFDLLL
jgi:hypothetical protein